MSVQQSYIAHFDLDAFFVSVERILDPVKYCKDLKDKILSLTNEMSKQGGKLRSDKKSNITIEYPNGDVVVFDRRMKTKDGWEGSIEIISNAEEIAFLSKDVKENKKNSSSKTKNSSKFGNASDINEFHRELGHASYETCRSTAKARQIELGGTILPCEDCAQGKAHQNACQNKKFRNRKLPASDFF